MGMVVGTEGTTGPYYGSVRNVRAKNRWIGAVIALAIASGGGALAYAKVVRPNVVPKNFGVVVEGKLYRSGELTPSATHRVVQERHVRTIIDLGAYDGNEVGERVARQTAEALGVERHVFRLEGDGTGNPNAYVEALRIITDPAKQPVLVHCSAGSQRTSACVLLYREIVEGKPIAGQMGEAYEHGHDPSRNPRLKPYLEQWHGQIGEAFRAGGLIQGQPKAEVGPPAKP
jgi:tyrosine-protein phosphatase SIW14